MTSIRRSQLLTPFGPGALMTNEKGVTLLVPAIDQWYPRDIKPEDAKKIKLEDFRIDEPRLSARLGVSYFRLPPDYNYRRPINAKLTAPAQRFPSWHSCPHPKCGRMKQASVTDGSKVMCTNKAQHPGGFESQMYQVRFVMMCDHGHVADFPWREWVHYSASPTCQGILRMNAGGGADLGSIEITCEQCDKRRRMGGVLEGVPETDPMGSTRLSMQLDSSGAEFRCSGYKPWAMTEAAGGEDCNRPLQGSLLNANNLHFSEIVSSIYLPPAAGSMVTDELLQLANGPKLTTLRTVIKSGMMTPEEAVDLARPVLAISKSLFSDEELAEALAIVSELKKAPEQVEVNLEDEVAVERAFRFQEYTMLQTARSGSLLTNRTPALDKYEEDVRPLLSGVTLIDRMRETRVLIGMSRVRPAETSTMTSDQRRNLLRTDPTTETDWLPAAVTYGEGIFLQFDTSALLEWEKEAGEHLSGLVHRYQNSIRYHPSYFAGPRHVLLHTFAHLLMNQLVYECGYSSASLRERLYVSQEEGQEMAGILIYTAAGDAEGTMGGLVRCGEPGYLEPIIRRAVTGAQWCAADPICFEAGRSGQGPDSCNLAACHNCALVPETSCEEFNRFLDRTCVVGEAGGIAGYFAPLLTTPAKLVS
jgi:hypothetical protein